MPYKIREQNEGEFKVCKLHSPKCFSAEPMPYNKAVGQLRAIQGSGLYDVAKKVADVVLRPDESKNKLYPGEYHGILRLPNGSYVNARYMGPGSRLDLRIPRGDKGFTPIDEVSEAHDIRYQLAYADAKDKEDAQRITRDADNLFNASIDRLRKEGKESEFNLKQAELIKAKVWLEKNDIIRELIYKFNSRPTNIKESPELTAMMRNELKRLEQKGYGPDRICSDKAPFPSRETSVSTCYNRGLRVGFARGVQRGQKEQAIRGKIIKNLKPLYTLDLIDKMSQQELRLLSQKLVDVMKVKFVNPDKPRNLQAITHASKARLGEFLKSNLGSLNKMR